MAISPVWSVSISGFRPLNLLPMIFLFRCTYLTPVGERGLGLRLSVLNKDKVSHEFTIGVTGDWSRRFTQSMKASVWILAEW